MEPSGQVALRAVACAASRGSHSSTGAGMTSAWIPTSSSSMQIAVGASGRTVRPAERTTGAHHPTGVSPESASVPPGRRSGSCSPEAPLRSPRSCLPALLPVPVALGYGSAASCVTLISDAAPSGPGRRHRRLPEPGGLGVG